MALSVLEIYNNALGLVGSRHSLTSLTDKIREAELCNQYYPTVREQVFAAAHWSCGKLSRRLTLLKERNEAIEWVNTEPMPPWRFAYSRPSNCTHPRYFTTYAAFEVGRYGNSNAFLCNEENPILIYTHVEPDTSLWDSYLTSAIYTGLAATLVRPLTGSARKANDLVQEANKYIMIGREYEANQDNTHFDYLPESLRARGISGLSNPNKFIYPVGPLFMGATG